MLPYFDLRKQINDVCMYVCMYRSVEILAQAGNETTDERICRLLGYFTRNNVNRKIKLAIFYLVSKVINLYKFGRVRPVSERNFGM